MVLKTLIRLLLTITVSALLTACANIARTPDNTNLNVLVEKFGQPTLICQTKTGTERAIWSQQPLGQYAWGGDLDDQRNLIKMRAILTDEHFAVLNDSVWDKDRVLCEFGPPALIETVGLPGNRYIVWNYRYKQDHVWDSLMFVFFDPETGKVVKFHPGPDPMHDNDGLRMF